MSENRQALDGLRRDIDRVDDDLRALLAERSALVDRISGTKRDGLAIRPGREASILRRLSATGDAGQVPAVVLVRVWRELMATFCRQQGPFSVAVCAPEKSVGYWDLARDHFGSATPMTLHKSPGLVLRAIAGGTAAIGLLPLPQDDDMDPWWRHLARTVAPRPQVIARLPFCENPGARFEDLEALAVAIHDIDPSSDDLSLLVVSTSDHISRASLNSLVADAGFDGRGVANYVEPEVASERLYLAEVNGLVAAADPRLGKLATKLDDENAQVIRVGGYARPIVPR